MQSLVILGSTGSIGRATLSVIKQNSTKFSIHSLIAHSNVSIMTEQCLTVHPKYACMICENAAKNLKSNLTNAGQYNIQILSGMEHACELVAFDDVDMVMSAMVGIYGLRPTFAAIRARKKILLANKEILVSCGRLFMQEICKCDTQIIPVDSEHNAIFQGLPVTYQQNLGKVFLSDYGISRIVLTASGGAFLKKSQTQFMKITPEEACIHPNWSMGKKISVDSATMMNKGLEYIEARHLFNAASNEIEILLHPQSIVHAMVHYYDGTVFTHCSIPDMRIPIAYAIGYPNRIQLKNLPDLDLYSFNTLDFIPLDVQKYPCLKLAIDVSNDSQSAAVALNAANEIAVEAFLNKKISFVKIYDVISKVLETVNLEDPYNIEDVLYIDQIVREHAMEIICTGGIR